MANYYQSSTNVTGPAQIDIGDIIRGGEAIASGLGSLRAREIEDKKLADQESDRQRIIDREKLMDERYNLDRQEKIDEKNIARARDYNTANAMNAIYNPEQYQQGKMIAEQKAIEDSIANLSPDEQILARAEIAKNYNPEISAKGWTDSALNQSNVDAGKIADLRMDMAKQKIQQEQFEENKRLQERGLAIQAENARQARQDRIDAKNEAKKVKPKYEQFYDKNGNVATVDVNDPSSLDNASKAGFYDISFINAYGKGSKGGTSSGSGAADSFFNKDKKDNVTTINYSSLGKDQQQKLDELSSSTFRGSTGEKKEVIRFLDKVDSVSKAAKLSKKEAEELVDLATGSTFGSEIYLNKGVLDARYGKEVFATPDGTITKSDALYNAFNRPETFKIVSVPQEGGKPDKKVFLDLTLPKHKAAFDKYSGEEAKNLEPEAKKIKETIVQKEKDDTKSILQRFDDYVKDISYSKDNEEKIKKPLVEFYPERSSVARFVNDNLKQESEAPKWLENIKDKKDEPKFVSEMSDAIRSKIQNMETLDSSEKRFLSDMKKTEYGKNRLEDIAPTSIIDMKINQKSRFDNLSELSNNIPESTQNLVKLLNSEKTADKILKPVTQEEIDRSNRIKEEIRKDPTFLFNKNIDEKYKDIVRAVIADRNFQKELSER